MDREGEPVTDGVAPRDADLLISSRRYMTEPMITCPKCQTEIKLTESLAAAMNVYLQDRADLQNKSTN